MGPNIKNNRKIFKEKFPLIKFPPDFEISIKPVRIGFNIKKKDAPNKISVIVWTGDFGENFKPEWEILILNYNDVYCHVSIDDSKGLVEKIEEALYCGDWHDDIDHDDIDHDESERDYNDDYYNDDDYDE